jgi:hypothetical protein
MKRLILTAVAAGALAFASTAAAALVPWTYDPVTTGGPSASHSDGVLHLA